MGIGEVIGCVGAVGRANCAGVCGFLYIDTFVGICLCLSLRRCSGTAYDW